MKERIIINAATEICGEKNLKKRFIKLYDSAPNTFSKYKPKLSKFIVLTAEIDDFIKVASVLKEGCKDGLAQVPVRIIFAELAARLGLGKLSEQDGDVLMDIDIGGETRKYNSFFEYMRMTAKGVDSTFSPQDEKKSLAQMREKPHFGEIIDSLRQVLVDRPGVFTNDTFQNNVHRLRYCCGLSQANYKKMPIHEVTTAGLMFDPNEKKILSFENKESFIFNIVGFETDMLIAEWNAMGLNGYQALHDNPITLRELHHIVETAFYRMEPYQFDYERADDLRSVISYAISLYREKVFADNYQRLFTIVKNGISPKKSRGEVVDSVTERIRILESELDAAKRQLMVGERNVETLKRSLKEANQTIYELNRQIPKPLEEEKIIVEEPTLEVAEIDDSEDRFNEFIQSNKVLVWGCRDSFIRKMSPKYPSLTFKGNEVLPSTELMAYDYVVVRTDFTSHPKYWNIKDAIKRAEIPFQVMGKGENSQDSLIQTVLRF